jgi:hypothetical protein
MIAGVNNMVTPIELIRAVIGPMGRGFGRSQHHLRWKTP